MKKTLILIALCLPALLLTQCAPKTVGKSSVTVVDEVAEMNKKYTDAQRADGKAVYTGYCEKCHQLYQPSEFTVKEWDRILPKMCKKAELNPQDAGLVRAWVIANAKHN
jgi:cytochrome c5